MMMLLGLEAGQPGWNPSLKYGSNNAARIAGMTKLNSIYVLENGYQTIYLSHIPLAL